MQVTDARSLQAAITHVDSLGLPGDDPKLLAARRMVTRRARALGMLAFIPETWMSQSMIPSSVTSTAKKAAPSADVLLLEKAAAFGLDANDVRKAYLEGIREFAMLPSEKRPPLSREDYAQARVNAFVRTRWYEVTA